MYQLKLLTNTGNTKTIPVQTKQEALNFVANLPTKLPAGVRVGVSCDLLSISGFILGKGK